MKIAIYARVSTNNKGQDVDMQLIDMRKSIESKAWSLTKEYVDRGVSGSKSSRPQLDKLMRDFARFLLRAGSGEDDSFVGHIESAVSIRHR